MAENKVKTAEEKAKEKTIQKMLAFVSAKTFSRHALLSEEEYVKAIGYEGEKESVAKCKALANMMSDYSVTIMKIKTNMEMMIGVFELATGKSAQELIDGGNNNGKPRK